MAETINVSDALWARFVDAAKDIFGYRALLEDGSPNPETGQQFARRQLKEWMRELCRDSERRLAHRAADAGLTDPPE